jgi:hypothetical protein
MNIELTPRECGILRIALNDSILKHREILIKDSFNGKKISKNLRMNVAGILEDEKKLYEFFIKLE